MLSANLLRRGVGKVKVDTTSQTDRITNAPEGGLAARAQPSKEISKDTLPLTCLCNRASARSSSELKPTTPMPP